jgi:Do/DeqQ family serine protease
MFKRLAVPLALVLCGFASGLVITGRLRSAQETSAQRVAAPARAPQTQALPLPAPAVPDFSTVASRAVGGVVNISSLQIVRRSNSPFASDPFFRYFFGDEEDWFGGRDERELSLGSGVLVSDDGYVVTNSHVIGDNVREIKAVLPDKREVRGRVVGTDPMTDIAVVKFNTAGLPVIPWGDSSKLKVGQWVLAIGSPFQFNQTVTLGIVSALGRKNIGLAEYEDFIQTDAAINPGNSGGALVDARGELVGINTAIYSQSGGYQGIGFAVPSNLARRVFHDLIKYGEVRRGSIGAMVVAPLTTEVARELAVRSTEGAYVSRMSPSSEAYQAGVRPGDVIVGFNGERVQDPSDFLRKVTDATIGSTATIDIVRDGRRMQVRVPVVQGGVRRRR